MKLREESQQQNISYRRVIEEIRNVKSKEIDNHDKHGGFHEAAIYEVGCTLQFDSRNACISLILVVWYIHPVGNEVLQRFRAQTVAAEDGSAHS